MCSRAAEARAASGGPAGAGAGGPGSGVAPTAVPAADLASARAAAIAKGQAHLQAAKQLRAASRASLSVGGPAADPARFLPPGPTPDAAAVEAALAAAKARHEAALDRKRTAAAVAGAFGAHGLLCV